MLNYDTNKVESAFKYKKLNIDHYESIELQILSTGYSLGIALDEFINYIEGSEHLEIMGKQSWNSFMGMFYSRFNIITNTFINYLEEGQMDRNDLQRATEALIWMYKVISGIFPSKIERNKPYAYDSLLAGIFYNSTFYYLNKVSSFFYDSIGLEEKKNEHEMIANAVKEEMNYIRSIENEVIDNQDKVVNISSSTQGNLIYMWNRTNEMIYKDMNEDIEKFSSAVKS